MQEPLIRPIKPKRTWQRIFCCCLKRPSSLAATSQDMSTSKSVVSQIAKLELPFTEFAMGRTYLIGKGTSRMAIQFNHISFDNPPRDFTKGARPPNVSAKLWGKRYELFSLFDEGVEVSNEALHQGIPEIYAEFISRRFRCCKVIDAYCGAGSLTVQLAKHNQVAALDTCSDNIAATHHNAGVYQVSDRVRFYRGDIFMYSNKLTADVVFLAPHWTFSECFEIIQLGSPIEELLEAASKAAPSVVLYLPVNYDPVELCSAVHSYTKFDQIAEFEIFYNQRKPVALVCYLGDCAKLPRGDLRSIFASKLGCRPDSSLTKLVETGTIRRLVDTITRTEFEVSSRGQHNIEMFLKNYSKATLKWEIPVLLFPVKGSLDTELVRLGLRNCKLGHFSEDTTSNLTELMLRIDGSDMIGAHAIVRFLYTRAQMHPTNPYRAYLVDSVIDLVRDIITAIKASPSVEDFLNKAGKLQLSLLESRLGKGYGEERRSLGDLYVEFLIRFYLQQKSLPRDLTRYLSSSLFSLNALTTACSE